MKVSKILELAAQCKTDNDAKELQEKLLKEVTQTKAFKGEYGANVEYYMEGKTPNVSFELHRQLSSEFTLEAKFEIRHEELTCAVNLVQMNDKLGSGSQDWSMDFELEELVEALPDETIARFSKNALEKLLHIHAQLMEKVGISYPIAHKTARAAWAKG